jgi:ATP/maltotriose-dependent transcriptional regulator MalT
VAGTVQLGREAFARRAWGDAHALLGRSATLEVDDLERLAVAAHLVGRDDESAQAWRRAHLGWLRLGDPDRAVRCAFWLSLALLLRGEIAQAGGWLARAERLVEQAGRDCAGRGFLLVPLFLQALGDGEHTRAVALAEETVALAQRFDDKDLLALGMLGRGQASLALGETGRGTTLLDEVMVSVTTAEVSPVTAGIVYCAVIEAYMDVCDLRRAAEWTEALHDWCTAQPDLVPYRGQCLVHRSQVLQAQGAWAEAAIEAERARQRLSDPVHPALGLAFYQQGELHRLRGELAAAERAYRAASRQGREPVPGFALVRLAQGKVEGAVAAVRRMVEESHGRLARPPVLAAAVEILLAAGEIEAARRAGDELAASADAVAAPLLRAVADYATGSVLLAEGALPAALASLRRACTGWRELEMPYEVARARVQIALACRALGDHDGAALELDAARVTFERLGARPDLARVAELAGSPGPPRPAPLTDRECEVLRLVASGRTNREIASALVISEHTVARHLQNMFVKLGLSSRAAATAYAYEHGLVSHPWCESTIRRDAEDGGPRGSDAAPTLPSVPPPGDTRALKEADVVDHGDARRP